MLDFAGARWHKSSRSANAGDCVEVADNLPDVVAVRDTKDRTLPPHHHSAPAWRDFLAGIRGGEFEA